MWDTAVEARSRLRKMTQCDTRECQEGVTNKLKQQHALQENGNAQSNSSHTFVSEKALRPSNNKKIINAFSTSLNDAVCTSRIPPDVERHAEYSLTSSLAQVVTTREIITSLL